MFKIGWPYAELPGVMILRWEDSFSEQEVPVSGECVGVRLQQNNTTAVLTLTRCPEREDIYYTVFSVTAKPGAQPWLAYKPANMTFAFLIPPAQSGRIAEVERVINRYYFGA